MRRRLCHVRQPHPRGFDGRERPVAVDRQRQSAQRRGAQRRPDRRAARPQASQESRLKGAKSMRLVIATALAAAALTACKPATGNRPPVTETEAVRIAEQAEASFTAGDVNAIMRHYADSAVMIDAAAPAPSADRKVQTGWAR